MDAFFSSLLGVDRWIPRALPESSHGHTAPGPARVRTRLRYRPNVPKCRLLSELHDDDGDTWRTAVARGSGRGYQEEMFTCPSSSVPFACESHAEGQARSGYGRSAPTLASSRQLGC